MLKNRDKLVADPVGLATVVKLNILRGQFPVHCYVAGSTSWCDTESSRNIWTTYLPHEIKEELKVSESFALRLAQAAYALRVHQQ